MEVGVGVWVKNEEDGDWIPSTVVSKVPIDNNENAGFEIGLRDEGGNEVTLTVGEAHQDLDNCKLPPSLPPLRTPKRLLKRSSLSCSLVVPARSPSPNPKRVKRQELKFPSDLLASASSE